ncbi:MAG: ABC transporter ATP-binding protein [Candidatus Dadabacteria bacterium]|nr:MAG: ABC transporter ATP-binding protein [Candidatus Dadabacteria bacterium]
MSTEAKKYFLIKRLLSLALPHKWELLGGMVFLLGGAAINLCFPQIIRGLINSAGKGIAASHPSEVVLVLVGLIALQGICFYGRSYLFGIVGHKVVAEVRNSLFSRLIRQDISFFDAQRAGDLVSRLASDTLLLQNAVSIHLSVFARYGIQIIAGIVLMATISVRLTLAIVAVLPILIGFSAIFGARLKRATRAMQEALGKATSVSEEVLYGIRTVKAFCKEKVEENRYANHISESLKRAFDRTRISATLSSTATVLMNVSIVLVVWYGIELVRGGAMGVGDLAAFLLYGMIVAVSFAFFVHTLSEFYQALGGAERIFSAMDAVPVIEVTTSGKTDFSRSEGRVEFQDVRFSYPSRPEREVLKGISFSANKGDTVALVGPSGAGKSTVISLLLRFYDVSSGAVLIDGINVKDLPPESIRERIGLVSQDPDIFSVTIREVLMYGKGSASEDELIEACRKANIYDFIQDLPQGLDTFVGDRGVQLSGGQKQRLAIARAMLKDPQILVLDEATSSLDSRNEQIIQEALYRLMKGRTTIIIAHRLSTIRNADQVLVMNEGEIIEHGSHDELVKLNGLYKELVSRQQLRAF